MIQSSHPSASVKTSHHTTLLLQLSSLLKSCGLKFLFHLPSPENFIRDTKDTGESIRELHTLALTYKDRNFITELEARGVVESKEAPSDLNGILKMLKRNSSGLQSLDELTNQNYNNAAHMFRHLRVLSCHFVS